MNRENSDFRNKHILHPGDTITSGKTVYTITDGFVAYGGSAVIYSSVSAESLQENPIKYVIKEVYPNEDLFERLTGIIRSRDPENMEELKWHREHIAEEHKLGGLCYNGTNLAVPIRHIIRPDKITIDGKEYTEDIQDGVFAVLDDLSGKAISFAQMLEYIKQPKSEDHPLRNGGSPTLHTTACLIEQVLLTLRAIHNNGVLFGDIHMDNVWFSKDCLELGIVHTSCFMDFGCSRPLIDGKRTDIIKGRIFSSKGFTPPELLPDRWAQGDGTISVQADIFSVGCLMLRCLFPDEYWDHFGKSPVIGPRTLQRDDAKRLGVDDSLRKKANEILARAMHPIEKERYPSADAMLEAIQQLKRDTAPPTYLLPKAPGSSESFVAESRASEVSNVIRILKINKPAFLWGCGGIGKSEIAIKVAEEFEKNSPKGAFFVHYTVPVKDNQEAMEETVLRMPIEGYKYEPEQSGMSLEEQRKADYRKRINILQEEYAGALLIIDNFDWPGKTLDSLTAEKSYLEMESIGLNLLFTTRNEVPGTDEVKELSRDNLLKLMRRWVTDPKISDQQLLALIDAVGGHTLTVDLIAKCLSRSRRKVTPEMMLDSFKNSKISEVKYPKVTHRALVKGEDPERIGHRDPKTAQIYEHLKALFDLSGLDEQMKSILCYATLLPDGGMDCLIFEDCLEDGQEDAFDYLLDCGWLKNSDENILSIHPIIREVCRGELRSADSACLPFAQRLWDRIDWDNYNFSQYLSVAEWFANSSNHLQDSAAWFAQYALSMYLNICKYDKAIVYGEKALQKLTDTVQRDAERIAVCNLYTASAYHQSGDYLTALRYSENGLDTLNDYQVENKALLASIYNITGLIMGGLGEYKEQVDWCRMALNAYQNGNEQDFRNISGYYINIALALEELGDLRSAYDHAMTAIQKQEMCVNPDHPEMAKALHALGHIVFRIAEETGQSQLYGVAINYYSRALLMRKKHLPATHPDFTPLYRDMAKVYYKVENWSQAKLYYQLASQQNDAFSMNELSMILIHGVGCDPDISRGFALLERAMSLGGIEASYNLGFCYLYGLHTSADYKKAEQCLLLAANHPVHPHAEACGQLYVLYTGVIPETRRIVPVNQEKALAYLEKGASLGLENIMTLKPASDE